MDWLLKPFFSKSPGTSSKTPTTDAVNNDVVTSKSPSAHSQMRQEIDDLCTEDPAMFNLFLLALEAMQLNKQDPPKGTSPVNGQLNSLWSWFGLARIHGGVGIPYNGVKSTALYDLLQVTDPNSIGGWINDGTNTEYKFDPKPTMGEGLGYCSHGSVLFPTWHRVYCMAFEQAVRKEMTRIAQSYTKAEDQKKNLALADKFRLPYWDLFRTRYIDDKGNSVQGLSVLFAVTKVRVIPKDGDKYVLIRNPLYSYEYPDEAGITAAFATESDQEAGSRFRKRLPSPVTTRQPAQYKSQTSSNVRLQTALYTGTTPTATGEVQTPGMDPIAKIWNSNMPYSAISFDKAGLKAKLYACLTASTGEDDADAVPLPYPNFATEILNGALLLATRAPEQTEKGEPLPNFTETLQSLKFLEPRSIESWHGAVHVLCGGFGTGGTMADVPIASFDPLFWHYHTFVDFILELYQARNAEYLASDPWWLGKADVKLAATDSNFNIIQGTWQNPFTPLTPFRIDRKNDGSERVKESDIHSNLMKDLQERHPFWTSADVQDINKLGYGYSGTSSAVSAKEFINTHYAWFQPRGTGILDPSGFKRNSSTDKMSELQVLPMFDDKGEWVSDISKLPIDGDANITVEKLYTTILKPVTSISSLATQPTTAGPSNTINPIVSGADTKSKSDVKDSSSTVSSGPVITKSLAESAIDLEDKSAHLGVNISKKLRTPRSQATTSNLAERSASIVQGNFNAAEAEKYLPPCTDRSSSASKTQASKVQTQRLDDELSYNHLPASILTNGEIRNWSFQFRYQRHALNTSFTTYVFLGDFPQELTSWSTTQNLILANHAFVTPNYDLVGPYSGRGDNPNRLTPGAVPGGNCGNCRQQAQALQIGADFTPLTPMLMDYVITQRKASNLVPESEAILKSLDREHVLPFLKRHLHWRIVRSDNVPIHVDDVADFKAWVHDEIMVLPKSKRVSVRYYGHTLHHEVTHRRPGGLNHDEHPLLIMRDS